MSFLLGEFKELSYNELVEINGGGNGTLKAIVQKVANAVKGNNKQGSGTGSGSGSSGGGGGTVTTSNGCSGACGGGSGNKQNSISGANSNTDIKKDKEELSTHVISTTNGCKGAYVSYYSQLSFTDDNMKGGTTFANSACGVTSIVNEFSEQYTKETGKTLTEAQLISAVQKAVDAGAINETDANVNDWNKAAKEISSALGLKGTWTYTDDASKATAIIISIDTKTSQRDYDGFHDHFVNDIGDGKYYDPYSNTIGYIKDLTLTSKWADDAKIKSAYRYLQYSTN